MAWKERKSLTKTLLDLLRKLKPKSKKGKKKSKVEQMRDIRLRYMG